jgi:MFS family permease
MGIWALGFVSLFMDVSSEIVHGLLPVFLVTVLGASVTAVGVLEGLAEGTALILKVFSGSLSDILGRRKPLVLLGYAMGALSKPFFAIAESVLVVYAARIFDRVGKGIRGAPRDALVADLAPEELRGRAFGLRQSLDTVGAFVGPALAIVLMRWSHDDFRTVFWIAAIPGLIAVSVLYFGVREPDPAPAPSEGRKIAWADLKKFQRPFWFVVAAGALFQLARFSEAFLILRASDVGLALEMAPLVLIVMNIVYSLVAYPVGALSDRIGREWFLGAGLAVLCAADVLLALDDSLPGIFTGIALWGLHMGLTQGILAALVADTCDARLRGTAFGLFNLFSAVALLLASTLAGILWDQVGPMATFLAGAILAMISLVAFGVRGIVGAR